MFITDIFCETDESKRSELYNIIIKEFYSHMHYGLLAVFLASILLTFTLWDRVEHTHLLIWTALNCGIIAMRTLFLYRFKHTERPYQENVRRGLGFFIAWMFFQGVVFGSAGYFLFPSQSFYHQVFLAVMIWVVALGAIGTYGFALPSYFAFSLPACLPLQAKLLMQGNDLHILLSIFGMLFLAGLLLFALNMNKSFMNTLYLQLDNKDLMKGLASEVAMRMEIERKAQRSAHDKSSKDSI